MQKQYEELSAEMQNTNKEIKAFEEKYNLETLEHRKAIKEAQDKYADEYSALKLKDQEVRGKLKFLFELAREVQNTAHDKAVVGYETGNMDVVMESTLESSSAIITTDGAVFYRTYPSFVIEDEALVPEEFVVKSIDKDAVKDRLSSGVEIPGIKPTNIISVVVRDAE